MIVKKIKKEIRERIVPGSLPDIDTDFAGERRGEVKAYMEQRFGENQVCSVGTYGTLKFKAALNDFGKLMGISIPTIRRLSKMIDFDGQDENMTKLFQIICSKNELKQFANKYPELINMMLLSAEHPKTISVHACATMIFPQEKRMDQWVPIRKQGDIIISEWEGAELDEAGFLKEDILGINQLNKFEDILTLIKQDEGKIIDLYQDVPLDDKEVFDAFCEGRTGDLFHFGAKGLSKYVVKVAPRSIDDLIACICLYRPGPMQNRYHEKFLKRRSGEEEIDYPIGGEEILKDSFGLMLTQEHIMLLCQKLAGFSLQRADDVRKAMGKKIMEKLKAVRQDFVEGYVKNYGDQGVDEEYANELWNQMEEFGLYAFNRSHAAAYSINGYNSMWLKVHYPIEFWSISFSRASKDDYPYYINEIVRSGDVILETVNINKSDKNIVADPETNALYWAINSIYQVGEKAQNQISEERKENGPYFSLEEFIDRHSFKGSAVNKSVIENLIYCGAFDDFSSKRSISEKRKELMDSYRKDYKVKIDKEKDEYERAKFSKLGDKTLLDWWWQLQQKKRSGFSFFDYKLLCRQYYSHYKLENRKFCDLNKDMDDFIDSYMYAAVGGYVLECDIKESSEKGPFAILLLESNYALIHVYIYAEIYEDVAGIIDGCEKNILLLDGKIIYNKHLEEYVLQTTKNSKIVKLTLA